MVIKGEVQTYAALHTHYDRSIRNCLHDVPYNKDCLTNTRPAVSVKHEAKRTLTAKTAGCIDALSTLTNVDDCLTLVYIYTQHVVQHAGLA